MRSARSGELGSLGPSGADFGRRHFLAGISERAVDVSQRIRDVVIAQREFGHAVVKDLAIDDDLPLQTVEHNLDGPVLVGIQKIRAR